MSHPQSQNGQTNDVREKIKMTPPVKGTFPKAKAKLNTLLKSTRANQKKSNAPKAK